MTPRRACLACCGVRKMPMLSGTSGASRDRSGLMTSHFLPPSVVLNRTLAPKNSTCGSTVESDLAVLAPAGHAGRAALLLCAVDPVGKLVVGDDMVELRRGLVVPRT